MRGGRRLVVRVRGSRADAAAAARRRSRQKKFAKGECTLLLTKNQVDFSDYLASIWDPLAVSSGGSAALSTDAPKRPNSYSPGAFCHEYSITRSRAWNTWKGGKIPGTVSQGPTLVNRRKELWWCVSLQEAERHYSWTVNKIGGFPALAARLQMAMKSGSNAATKAACHDIFKWGGVARKAADRSTLWVAAAAGSYRLIANLKVAARVLQPTRTVGLSMFNRDGLLMNSAMTKVYAAVDPTNIMIYDGRVGAALCLLVRHYLDSKTIRIVPPDLAFLWGPPQDQPSVMRNPSAGPIVFKSLNQHGVGERERAETARRANLIVWAMIMELKKKGVVVQLESVEKALFMIGYDVR